MRFIDVAILSVIQGITEFLPISSSGHLVLAQTYLGLEDVPVLFNLILHLGTACATILVYYRLIGDILRDLGSWVIKTGEERREVLQRGNVKLAGYIILSSAFTGVLGFLFRETIKSFFFRPLSVSLFLFLTGIILFITRFIHHKGKQIGDLGIHTPLIVGGAQTCAMLPGVSRSGVTISAGLYLGMERSFAGSYSFLLSIPSILGASIVEVTQSADTLHSISGAQSTLLLSITGFLLSLIAGYFALRFFLSFLQKGKLYTFAYYCFSVALISGLLTRAYF
jgi:undecaprenyl-diphosphatase